MKKISVFIVFLMFVFNGNLAFAENDGQIAKTDCFKFNQSLKYTDGFWNDKNEAIFELQQALFDTGYSSIEPDGSFGMETLRSVTLFQRKNDLLATGYFGGKTRLALEKQFCDLKILKENQLNAIIPVI